MPTSIEKTKTIELDGKTVELRPLKIKQLRKFMSEFDRLTSSGEEVTSTGSLEIMLQCACIAMEQYDKSLSNPEDLEEIADLDDIYTIIEAASGIRLGQGNAPAAETDQDGMI